jgi:hypothetical protein
LRIAATQIVEADHDARFIWKNGYGRSAAKMAINVRFLMSVNTPPEKLTVWNRRVGERA